MAGAATRLEGFCEAKDYAHGLKSMGTEPPPQIAVLTVPAATAALVFYDWLRRATSPSARVSKVTSDRADNDSALFAKTLYAACASSVLCSLAVPNGFAQVHRVHLNDPKLHHLDFACFCIPAGRMGPKLGP